MKLLKEKYKTFEGARKRAAFENGLAPGEFKRGDKARLYRYNVIQEGDHWRVARKREDLTPGGSIQCPHCFWGFAPSVIEQHIREKHS